MSSFIIDGNCISGSCQSILFLNSYGFLLYWSIFGLSIILAILLGYYVRKAQEGKK